MMEQWWGKAEAEGEEGDQEVERGVFGLEGWTDEWEEEITWVIVMVEMEEKEKEDA